MITRDLRAALARAAAADGPGEAAEPGLRPTGTPGQYAASLALALGPDPRETAQRLAAVLAAEPWIETAEVTGPGYVTITVTPAALAAVAERIAQAGRACVTSHALAGVTVPAPPPGDPLDAATWEGARAALAARLTARLAAAAGATVAEAEDPERLRRTLPGNGSGSGVSRIRSDDSGHEPGAAGRRPETDGAAAVAGGSPGASPRAAAAFAGRDAVLFTLARAVPGKPLRIDPRIIASHVPGNPAYAVRYAHARAASGVRWAVTSPAADTIGFGEIPQCLLTGPDPETGVAAGGSDTMASCAIGPARRDSGGRGGSPPRETAVLLDALSWLPERVAVAARRGRPDEFARYLEDLASVTVDVLSSASHRGDAAAPGSARPALARAARTGLAAGLGLLGVGAPDRLLRRQL